MMRRARTIVALLLLAGLVSPLLGACVCAEMAGSPKPHACCPGDESSRLQAVRNCCSAEARDTGRATLNTPPIVAAPVVASCEAVVTASLGVPAPGAERLYISTRPLVLRI